MDQATQDAGGTFRLIYRSHDRIPDDVRRAELGELFSTARKNNKGLGITGALVLSDEFFVQTLEGEEPVIRALFSRIEADPRHDSVKILETGFVPARVFPRWAMAKVSADGEPDIPLIAHADGIAKAAPRGDSTPEQERILSIMREAALGADAPMAGA